MNRVEIYTDGACKGNPGPGGWGVLLRSPGHEKELFGGEPLTTNNRMELTAVIEGLRALKRPCEVELYLDSQYVRQGITEWIHGWKAKGWRTASSSMRLLVVPSSPPNNSFTNSPDRSNAPQPPGPGLPLQAPSV